MGLNDKLLGKKDEGQEFPDDFEPTDEAKEVIDGVKDDDINAFLKKKQKEKQEKPVEPNKPEPLEVPEEKEPVEKPPEDLPEEQIEETKPESKLSNLLTLYINKSNVEKSKQVINDAIKENYPLALQAGIKINKENFEKLKPMLDFFIKNGFLVVVSGEKVEPVF